MKKSLYISGLVLMLAGMSFTSCSNFLDSDNKTTANKNADDDLINRPDQLLYQAYASTYDFAFNVVLNEEGTDLYIPVRGKAVSVLDNYSLSASDDDVYSYYKEIYTTINDANAVTYYVNKAVGTGTPTAAQNGYLAEAAFLRCWGYYLLTQQFGPVPYVTEYYKDFTKNFPRIPVATIYDSCIAELTNVYNQGILPTVASHSNPAQPTQEACAALISKLYLAKGWDCDVATSGANVQPITDDANFLASVEWAEKSLNISAGATPGALTMSFADKWNPSKDNNKEVMWAIQSNRDAALGAHGLQNDYGNYYGTQSNGYKQVGSQHAQSIKSLRLFAKGDKRYEGTFMTTLLRKNYMAAYNDPTYHLVGYQYFPYYYSSAEVKTELGAHPDYYVADGTGAQDKVQKIYIMDNTCTEFTVNDQTGDASEGSKTSYQTLYENTVGSGVCVKKFDDPTSTKASNDDYRCIPIFHTSDMYLTAAEAYYMAGYGEKSLEYVNAVRARSITTADANLGATYSAALTTYGNTYSYSAPAGGFKAIDIILDERARELYAERTRWIDLRRTRQLERYNQAYNVNLNGATVKTLRPIPTNEIGANDGISESDQNPGY